MSNATTKAAHYDLGLGVPLWVVLVWAAAGVIVVAMVALVVYLCVARKKGRMPSHDQQIDLEEPYQTNPQEMFENYPRGLIADLHMPELNVEQSFSPSFTRELRIPRAAEVKISEPVNGIVITPSATPPLGNILEPPGTPNGSYLSTIEDRDLSTIAPSRVVLSREASFQLSSLSEESKAKQLYREKMLVNELRQKLRNGRKINEEVYDD